MEKKCSECGKNLPLLYFSCKCKLFFCIKHYIPEKHNCTFDYKSDFKKAILKNNPVIAPDKI